MTGIYSSVRSSLLLNYESQESETEESEDWGRLVTNQSCNQRAAQTVWADAEAASRLINWWVKTPVEIGVLLHHTLGSGVERVIRLANEVENTEVHHLLDSQALALTQHFQPLHFSSERDIVIVAMIGSFA